MEESEAAAPILGSSLLAAALRSGPPTKHCVGTGVPAIDEQALRGGFRCGEITSIAGGVDTEKSILVLHSIATYLIAEKDGEIALIDTNGSFAAVSLRDVISHHLENLSRQARYKQSGYVYEKVPAAQSAAAVRDFKSEATRMLCRVKVMRVFDFAGIVEAVDEVRESWEKSDNQQKTPEAGEAAAESANLEPQARLEREISDSQESATPESQEQGHLIEPTPNEPPARPRGIKMLVVDNIANPVSSMMAKSTMQGQALLTTFLRSLHQLTTRYQICTILINIAVGLSLGPSTTTAADYHRRMQENVSVFASTMGKPALGRTYANLIDTSIFISKVPKTKDDAEMAYGGGERDPARWKNACVLEVVRDRYGEREGRWVAFEIVNGFEIRPWG